MSENVQIDRTGRLVIPKALRDHFHLRAGDTLTVRARGEFIELRPTAPAQRLKCVNGILVVAGETPVQPTSDLVAEAREERIQELMDEGRSR